MASPFRIFRKYQKTLLVVAGVALMFVFVLGDSLSAILRRLGSVNVRRGGMEAGAVAVRWNDGKLTNAELNSLVLRRRVVNDFLRGVELEGRMAVINAGAEPQPLRVQILLGPETPQQGVEDDVVRTELFADAARRAGMTVSDENINHYLQELGRGRVSGQDMRTMLTRMRLVGRGASTSYLFEGLRNEMLAHNYLASYAYALATVTPQQRWQDWLRANDRVVVEAAALPVTSFLVDVPEPTDAEVSEFFDLYKNREPMPDYVANTELPSPRPGFAVPRKIDLRYVRADYDQLLDKLESEVTDKEIQDYYDANKKLFIRADSGVSGGPSEEAAAPATSEQTPADGKTEAAPAGAPPAAGTTPPAETKPAADGQTSGTAPAADATPPSSNDSTPAAPATGDSSRLDPPSRPSPFRLVALEQDADDASAGSASQGNAPADSVLEFTDSSGHRHSAAPAAQANAPTNGDAQANVPPTETPATETPAAEKPATPAASESPEKPVEYQPLSEVRDQIRRELASQKVNEHLLDLMGDLKSKLNATFSNYFGAVLDAKAAGHEPPAPPTELADLSALAKENGLQYDETGPLSALELRELPVGKSVDADTNTPLLQMMFSNEIELYQPVATFDVDNNRYLVIKVSDTPRRVPELSEVREEVVHDWKLQKAAELADTHAKELAAKVQETGSTLTDYFADDSSVTVQRTDPFAWLTIGDVSRTGMVLFRLSEPTGVVAAGPDFMRTVFELGADQVGAVLNHDHSIAYVLRVAEHQDTPRQLQTTYLDEADRWYGLATMNQLHVQNAAAVLGRSFSKAAGVDWLRPPDQITSREED